jgi:hypothetical protein
MARSTLTTTIQRIQGLADQVLGLPPEEYHYFLDLIDPQPEPAAPAKKTRKKRGPRSSRASGMAAAIKNSLEQGKQAAANAGDLDFADNEAGPKCGTCGNAEDYQDHFQPSPNYHEFEAPKSKKAAK